jgi:hypothetical protein
MTADGGTGSDNANADGSAGSANVGDTSSTGAANSSELSAGAPRCPHCEAPMYKRHCKYVCPQHGVIIDCSDPFR